MKQLNEYINESLSLNKWKNIVNKVLHPFSKTYELPYIFIENGNCFAPHNSVNYSISEINDPLIKCQKYIAKNYWRMITKKSIKKEDDINKGIVYEFGESDDNKALEIFKDLVDKLSTDFKPLYDLNKDNIKMLRIRHDNYSSPDNAYVNEFTFEFELRDKHGEFMNYLYPGIMLVTHSNIKAFKSGKEEI